MSIFSFCKKRNKSCSISNNNLSGVVNFLNKLGKSNECVVIANGPSLKESLSSPKIMNFVKTRKQFCVNCFPATDLFDELKPNFFVLMDPFFWSKNLSKNRIKMYTPIAEAL